MMNKELELYIHIPFCARKCAYCDFFSGAFSDEQKKRYFEDLRAEIRERQENPDLVLIPGSGGGTFLATELPVRSIFIGGGTPSLSDLSELSSVIGLLYDSFRIPEDIEFTIEANPGTLTEEKLRSYRSFGINRLSLGLQSADDRMLRVLGRIHSFSGFLRSYELARSSGFDNISIDLMSGLPGETAANFEKSLDTVLWLEPEHLSVYSLIIEENTPFYDLYGPFGTKAAELPKEELDREIYRLTEELLCAHGYEHYEISNYAKKGRSSRHNLGYWTGVPYLGFGAAAASFTGLGRAKNASSLSYRSLPKEEQEILTERDRMSEFMILGLRLIKGISDREFRDRFSCSMYDRFGEEIRRHLAIGTLIDSDGHIFLSPYGLDVANAVMADFL